MVETTLGLGDYRYKYLYGCSYARTFVYRPGTLTYTYIKYCICMETSLEAT